MARNTLKLDTKGFEEMIRKLDSLGGDVRKAVTDALQQAAETIKEDTTEAIDPVHLPAGGKYSSGDTRESIIQDTTVHWEGLMGWVPVGFDFSKAGAGGYLITGTPRMMPDQELQRIFKRKKYMNQIQKDMYDVIMDYVIVKMEKN